MQASTRSNRVGNLIYTSGFSEEFKPQKFKMWQTELLRPTVVSATYTFGVFTPEGILLYIRVCRTWFRDCWECLRLNTLELLA